MTRIFTPTPMLVVILVILLNNLASLTSAFQAPIDLGLVDYLNPPAGAGAMAPNLVAQDGDLYLSWIQLKPGKSGSKAKGEGLEKNEKKPPRIWQFQWAKWSASEGWSEPITIEQSTQIVANWADYPAMKVLDGRVGQKLLAFYPEKSGGASPYAYDVVLKSSDDGGKSWVREGRAHDDLTPTEHGFCTILPDVDATGDVGASLFWLDGRAMAGGDHGSGGEGGDMSLRSARFVNGRIADTTVLDLRTCECCSTDAALTAAGPVVVYRDRDGDEIRDISMVRLVDGKWSLPKAVHVDGWMMPGCPVNGPTVAAAGAEVGVAWYTAAGGGGKVMIAFSTDSGASFGDAIVVDSAQRSSAPVGRVDVEMDTASGGAFVSWLDKDDTPLRDPNADYDRGGGVIRVCRVSADGVVGAPLNVAITTPARLSGFPVMTLNGSDLVFTYTVDTDPLSIQVARVKVSDVPR